VPVTDRQALERPTAANEVWSMDFVFDRVASGRMLKCLAIVDDGTHEAVAVHPEHAIGGERLVRILDQICLKRGYPRVIRTDNVLPMEVNPQCSNRSPLRAITHIFQGSQRSPMLAVSA
jgi:transposase InsO family protein